MVAEHLAVDAVIDVERTEVRDEGVDAHDVDQARTPFAKHARDVVEGVARLLCKIRAHDLAGLGIEVGP